MVSFFHYQAHTGTVLYFATRRSCDTMEKRKGRDVPMPRQSREKSESGTYHVMIRGIDRRNIFEDDEDNEQFLTRLARYKAECGCELWGYCLMGNHVHLLIRENTEPMERFFRKLGASYVYYFNHKYDRVGHLFQDRFRSEAIRDDAQLLQTLRYIHRNPIQAGLCASVGEYPYSSYPTYLGTANGPVDTEFILGMIPTEEFVRYTNEAEAYAALDLPQREGWRPTEREAKTILQETLDRRGVKELRSLTLRERDDLLAELKRQGLPIAQINRLTAFSRTIISRASAQ